VHAHRKVDGYPEMHQNDRGLPRKFEDEAMGAQGPYGKKESGEDAMPSHDALASVLTVSYLTEQVCDQERAAGDAADVGEGPYFLREAHSVYIQASSLADVVFSMDPPKPPPRGESMAHC